MLVRRKGAATDRALRVGDFLTVVGVAPGVTAEVAGLIADVYCCTGTLFQGVNTGLQKCHRGMNVLQ